ncbi:gliding motility-associated C-terminal domain-containing protein [Catalinimonas sp. 4WD22]|uniref:lectin-like domain-containing protein n=1 Tax=Catalinimonas locisalis TaxID=3133978 RepID=UPI003100B4F2
MSQNKPLLLLSIVLLLSTASFAQETFLIKKDAIKLSQRCFSITPDQNNQFGSIWWAEKQDISKPFQLDFVIYMGDKDSNGADGIAFVIHTDPRDTLGDGAYGEEGGGLGFSEHYSQGTDKITPSVAIEFDTWRNSGSNDPNEDHTAVVYNGDLVNNHRPIIDYLGNTVRSTPIKPASHYAVQNVENDECYHYTITWDPINHELKLFIEGVRVFTHTGDILNDIFNGQHMVRYGFTGSTGGARNEQTICLLGGNTEPYAQDDHVVTTIDTPVNILVTANDNDPDGDDLLRTVITQNPTHGTISVINQDQVLYTPNPGFEGTDTFMYKTCDVPSEKCYAKCDMATVTIDVLCQQPYEITANATSPNESCDGGTNTGSAFADINPPTATATTDELIGLWEYDSDFQDSSPAGGNSILKDYGNPAFVSTEMGQGVQLDGIDDYLAMTGPKYSLNNYTNVTTSSWIRTSANTKQVIISYDDQQYWELSIEAGTGVLNWTVQTDAGPASLLSNTSVNDGQWHFVTAVFDNGTLRIFIDGEANTQMSLGTQYGTGATRYGRIGVGSEANSVNGSNDPANEFFQGTIEDTRLYDKSLTPGEINDLYISATPYPPLTASDFNFYWFEGTNYPGVTIATGQLVTGLADGVYTVVAENKITGCLTDPIQVTITRVIPTFEPVIWQVAPFTSCSTPNGALQAGIISGSDTISAGYDFVWYESDYVLTGDTISISNTATNLSSRSYSVLIRNQLTNCDTLVSMSVTSNVSAPLANAQVNQHINSCNAPNAGVVEASVGGDTTNYSFTWYEEGSNISIGNTALLGGLGTGRYSVIATDLATGCSSSPVTVEINDFSTAPNVSFTITPQSSCDVNNPNGNLSALVNTAGGTTTSGYTFRWYKGHNNSIPAKPSYTGGPNVNGLETGNYRLVVTDNVTGCSTTVDTNISENKVIPSLNLDSKNDINQCGTSGNAAFSVAGNTSNYNFYWYSGTVSAPDTTTSLAGIGDVANVSSLDAGTYTVFAAHKNTRCLSNGITFQIQDNTYTPQLNAEVLNIQTSCTSLPNGILFASVDETAQGGTARDTIGYTFEWYLGNYNLTNLPATADATGATANNMAAGDYTVRAINTSTNCVNLAYITLVENLTYPNIETLTVNHANRCEAPWGSSASVITDGGKTTADGYTFRWRNTSTGTNLSETSNTLNNIPPGNYRVTVTSPFGCQSAPRNFTINPVTNPFVVTTAQLQPQRACAPVPPNGQLRALADGDSADYTFVWFSGNLSKAAASTATPLTFGATAKGLAAGAYTVLVTDNTTACSVVAYRNVTSNQVTPIIDAPATLIHADRCSDPWGSSIAVTVDGGLTHAEGYTFRWRNTSTGTNLSETSNTLNNIPPGNYRVTVTSPFGCQSAPRNFTINPVTNPFVVTTAQLQPQRACAPVPPNGQLRALADGDSADYTFVWFSGNLSKAAASTATPLTFGATAKGLAAGAYTVLVTDNTTACSVVAYRNVTSNQVTPIIDAPATLIHADRCSDPWGSSIAVTVDGGLTHAEGYTFRWRNTSTGTNLSETSNTLNNIPPGNYRVTVTSPFGCQSAPRNFTIEDHSIKPTVNLSATDNISCSPSLPSGTITASGFTGAATDYTFEWFINNTSGASVPAAKISNNGTRVSSLSSGTYMLRMTDNANQCITTSTISLNNNPDPVPIVDTVRTTIVTSCTPADYDGEIELTLRNGFKMIPPDLSATRNYTFRLTGLSGYDNSISSTSNVTFTNLGPGDYQAIVTDELTGCTSAPIDITLIQKPLKEINISYTRPTNCGLLGIGNGDASISVETDTNSPSIGGSPGFSFSWTYEITGVAVTNGSDGSFSSSRTLLGPGYYVVEIEDLETGCRYTERFLLKMADPPILTVDDTDNSTQCASEDGSIDVTLTASATSLPLTSYRVNLFRGNAIKVIPDATWIPLLGNNHTFNNLEPGEYLVALQIGISPYCYISDSLVVIGQDYADPTVNITKDVDYSCNSSGTGRLSATITGSDGSPTSDFTLNWYNGSTVSGTPFFTGSSTPASLSAGTYTLEVIDNSGLGLGCTYDTTITLNNIPKNIQISNYAKTDRDGCDVNNFGTAHIVEITEDGSTVSLSNYTVLLYDENLNPLSRPGNGTVATPFRELDNGVYFLVAENNTTSCLSTSQRIEIFNNGLPPVPSLALNQADFSCGISSQAIGQLTASAYGASDGDADQSHFSFQWFSGQDNTNPADALLPSQINGSYGEQAINLPAGYYTVLVTDLNGNGNGCTETKSFEVPAQSKDIELTATVIPPFACGGEGDIEVNSVSVFDNFNGTQADVLTDYTLVLQDENGVEITTLDGNISTTFTNIPLGNYRVLARHKTFNCWTSTPINKTIDDLNVPPVAVLSMSQPDFSCGDASKATGHLIASGYGPFDGDTDVNNFSFQWFSGQNNTNPADALLPANLSGVNNSEAVNLAAGYYTVVVTDINGNGNACSDITTMEVPTRVKEINVQTNVIDPLACSGLGNIEVNSVSVYDPINGDQPANLSDYMLVLQDASGTDISTIDGAVETTFVNLTEASYQIVARHKSFNCWISNPNAETIIDLNEEPEVNLLAVEEDFSCAGGNPTGAISISARGPNDNDTDPTHFDYIWYRGNIVDGANQLTIANIDTSNPARATGLLAGVYTVEVIDLNGRAVNCSSILTFNVPRVTTNIVVTAIASDQLICSDGGQVYVNSVTETLSNGTINIGDPEVYDYQLYDEGRNLITASGRGKPSDPFTNLAEGNYFIQAVSTSGNNCLSQLKGFTINDLSKNPIVSVQKQSEQFSNNPDPSTWTGSLSATVNVNPLNPLDSLTDNFAYTYAWYTAATYPSGTAFSNAAQVDQLAEGNYYVVVTNTVTGCASVASAYINKIIQAPEVNYAMDTDPTSCLSDGKIFLDGLMQNGNPANLDDFEFILYSSYPDDVIRSITAPANDTIFSNLAEGSYLISIRNVTLNIEGELKEVKIEKSTSLPYVQLDVTNYQVQSSCDPATPNGVLAVEVYEADYSIGNYTYQWYNGREALASAMIAGATEPVIRNLESGFYTIEVINQETQCVKIQTLYLEENISIPIVSASTSLNIYCDPADYNGSVSAFVINASSRQLNTGRSGERYRFTWYRGSQAKPKPEFVGKTWEDVPPGDYTVMVTDLWSPSCFSEPVTVTLLDKAAEPEITIIEDAPQSNCDPELVNGKLSAYVNDSTSVYQYTWYDEVGEIVSEAYQASNLSVQTYTVEVVNLVTGCTSTASYRLTEEIKLVEAPQITINAHQTRCDQPDGIATATIPGIIEDFEFFWYDASGNLLPVPEPATRLSNLEAGEYSLKLLEKRSGCETTMVSFEIRDETVPPTFEVMTEPSVCDDHTGLIRIIPHDVTSIDRVEWQASNMQSSLGNGFELTELYAGNYKYTVFGTNGCIVEGDVTVEADIKVYNGVSPNGDGDNDYFHVDCLEYFLSNNVKIFNRAGALVYEADYYDNTSTFFEGRGNRGLYIGGKDLPTGTYFYVIDKRDNISKPKTGYLELTW